jgi:hypothetical protein
LRRAFLTATVCVVLGWLIACGSYTAPNTPPPAQRNRAFVSNSTGGGGVIASLQVVDTGTDKLVLGSSVSAGPQPTFMVQSGNGRLTFVFNPINNSINVVNNAQGTSAGAIVLPDVTESIVTAPDGSRVFAAVRNASVLGQPPGSVEVLSTSAGTLSDSIPIPNVRWLFISPNGNRVLAFSDTSDTVFVIATSLTGTSNNPVTPVTDASFSRPIWATITSDNSTAYILSCGAECGGTASAVTQLDLTTNPPNVVRSVPVVAGTVGVVNGNTLYIAGSPPGQACDASTSAMQCGQFEVVDIPSLTVTTPGGGVLIADGFHTRIAVGSNGKVFAGSGGCTTINNGTETRGCLSIVDAAAGTVVTAPDPGDVTGIQPIPNRNVVYVVQGGELRIYDTTTDTLQATQINIVGQAVDVKTVP